MSPHQITQWQTQTLDALPQIFSDRRAPAEKAEEELQAALYQQIGPLTKALDWLKEKLGGAVEQKRGWIEPAHGQWSMSRPWELIGLARFSVSDAVQEGSEGNLRLMRLLDEHHTEAPVCGGRRMTAWVGGQGRVVTPKRVRR